MIHAYRDIDRALCEYWLNMSDADYAMPAPFHIFNEIWSSFKKELARFNASSEMDIEKVRTQLDALGSLLYSRFLLTDLLKAYISPKSFKGALRGISGMLSLQDAPALIGRHVDALSSVVAPYKEATHSYIQKLKDFTSDAADIFESEGNYIAPVWRGLSAQRTMKEFWLFIRTILQGGRTTLGGTVAENDIYTFTVGQVYFHALKLFKRAYAVQMEFPDGRPHFHIRDFQYVVSTLRSLLFRITYPSGPTEDPSNDFPGFVNDSAFPEIWDNYPLLALVREVLLGADYWAVGTGVSKVDSVWTEERRQVLFEKLSLFERAEESENFPGTRSTLVADLRDAWKELRDIASSGFSPLRKEIGDRTHRVHISGERMEVLKSTFDRVKFKMIHAYRDIDRALCEEHTRFTARHWAPGLPVQEGDLFLFDSVFHKAKYTGETEFSKAPYSGLSNYTSNWQQPTWEPNKSYKTNDVVVVSFLRSSGISDPHVYRARRPNINVYPTYLSSLHSINHDTIYDLTPWENLTRNWDATLNVGDKHFALIEEHNGTNLRLKRTDLWTYEARRFMNPDARASADADPGIAGLLSDSDSYARHQWGTNIRKHATAYTSSGTDISAGNIGSWTSSSEWSTRRAFIRNRGESVIPLVHSKEWGFWTYPLDLFSSASFLVNDSFSEYRIIPKPTALYHSRKWLKENSTSGTSAYLIGGDTVGEETTHNVFNFDFAHAGSSLAKYGVATLQLLEMFFFSSTYNYLQNEWARITLSPASSAAFGYIESTRYNDLDYGFQQTIAANLYETFAVFERSPYVNSPDDLENYQWKKRFRAVLEANGRAAMSLLNTILFAIKDDDFFFESFKDNVIAECERIRWKSLLRISNVLTDLLSATVQNQSEQETVTAEEVRLLARLLALLMGIIMSVLSGDDRIKSAVFYDDGVLKFDNSILDSVFIKESDAEVIIQRGINMAIDLISRKESQKPLADSTLAINFVSDLQVANGNFSMQISKINQDERFFYLNEQRV
ncbi:hypothetical protein HAT2_00581 [Candidatus Similichlamydia laticola]|uniref:Uncharacterized protein n=2 Tax=Candidatus Similichlamydia laticola TaxID=2170265 RepID=A0A369KK01_9BACT|nr:hypothetical protein HAT2_00581 [Candidatus Similichlamydia laticola]